jgi:membrane-associated phospholipid phosphatase
MRKAMTGAVVLLVLGCGMKDGALAQLRDQGETPTLHHLSHGMMNSLAWYDIPVGMIWLSQRNFPIAPSPKLSFPAPGFDVEIQRRLAGTGTTSPGSVDPHLYPRLVFAARMLYTLAADEWSDRDIDERDYQHAFVFYKSVLYTHTLTELVKNVTRRQRPDNGDDRSFFSGHTSLTFVTSAFLFREIDHVLDSQLWALSNPTLRTALKVSAAVVLYGWAGYVGYSRILDNKHFLSDVLVGAAVGILMGNVVYNGYFSEQSSIPAHISLGYIQSTPALSIVVPLN